MYVTADDYSELKQTTPSPPPQRERVNRPTPTADNDSSKMHVWESAPLDAYHTTRVTSPELAQNESNFFGEVFAFMHHASLGRFCPRGAFDQENSMPRRNRQRGSDYGSFLPSRVQDYTSAHCYERFRCAGISLRVSGVVKPPHRHRPRHAIIQSLSFPVEKLEKLHRR